MRAFEAGHRGVGNAGGQAAVGADGQRRTFVAHPVRHRQSHADGCGLPSRTISRIRVRSCISAPARRAASTSSASSTVRSGAVYDRGAVDGLGPTLKASIAEVDVHLLDGRAAGRRQRLQQAPLGEETPWSGAT